MAIIQPFQAIRPTSKNASDVAALPYDVYDRKEAKEAVSGKPLSFLNIDRPETQFPDDYDMYAPDVYKKAAEMLEQQIKDGVYVLEDKKCLYIYQLVMNGRSQTGVVGCASIDDYLDETIKKHENTRVEKELDRINHIDALSAQTGPIFLAYKGSRRINDVVEKNCETKPEIDIVCDDGIKHRIWIVKDEKDIAEIEDAFKNIDSLYIADGHHRAASAVKVGLKRREKSIRETGSYDRNAEYNFFMSVIFPADQLMIMPYNRVVKDLNGLSEEEFIKKVSDRFNISAPGDKAIEPTKKYDYGMYLSGKWYTLSAKDFLKKQTDPVESLDVSVLQKNLLEPVLGIKDPRTDKRIDFIGGIRGTKELERRCKTDSKVAFSMWATSINELFDVADARLLMPPKSTWFEPKLRSGLLIHKF